MDGFSINSNSLSSSTRRTYEQALAQGRSNDRYDQVTGALIWHGGKRSSVASRIFLAGGRRVERRYEETHSDSELV